MTYFDRTFQDGSLISPITLPKEVQQYIYSFIYDEVMTHHWMNKYELDKVIKMEGNLKYENHHYTHKFIKKISVLDKIQSKHMSCIYFQQLNEQNKNYVTPFSFYVDVFLQSQYRLAIQRKCSKHIYNLYSAVCILIYAWKYKNSPHLLENENTLVRQG